MIENRVNDLIQASLKLTPVERLELVAAVTRSLHQHYAREVMGTTIGKPNGSYSINRTPPVVSLAVLKADFWPEDETADDLNDWIAQQREADRSSDI